MPLSSFAGGRLTVDLDAIAANYRTLQGRLAGAACGAAVKADAYGLGVRRVVKALAAAGCRCFFVATYDEGLAVRAVAPRAAIYVLNGLPPRAASAFRRARLRPSLNDLGQIARWAAAARQRGRVLPAAVHLDTGMNRLGLPPREIATLGREMDRLAGIHVRLVMSHLACAEEPEHPLNGVQRARFERATGLFPGARRSLANSAGIFLGRNFHFDLARPGIALYGVNPRPSGTNPMRPVVSLHGRVLQVRDIDAPDTVGYGAAFRASLPTRIATISVGYADGLPRSLSGVGYAVVDGTRVPLLGRVSMDLLALDVSAVPAERVGPGSWATLIGAGAAIEDVARAAGTIPYEILTRLGRRLCWRYRTARAGGA
ncbi:MAG: alanine racemase [Alphaproteobacteria bacterium]|nr:alanine racemase [Alphaproteobacteria bacterium]